MRRITLWIMTTLTALVLLFSYHTSTNTTEAVTASALMPKTVASSGLRPDGTTTTAPASGASGTSSSGSAGGSGSSSGAASGTGVASAAGDGTYTGATVMTQYGPVQVKVTVSGGKVSQVQAVQYPFSNGRDRAINSYAVPILDQEASTAKSAQIDMVSGATFTSHGYIRSLQSALDEANL